MRNPPEEATCPICGRHFDPSETRGWCPNPSCGEWQHPSFPLDGTADAGGTGPPSHRSGPSSRGTSRKREEPDQEAETDDGPPEECPDCGADLSGIPTERLSTCPICLFDLTPLLGDAGADDTAEPSDARDAREEPVSEPDPEPEPRDATPAGDAEDPASAPVESIDAITRGYVHRLTDAGVTTVGELVGSNPDTLSARTGISTRRIREWIDDAPLDPPDDVGVDSAGPAHTGTGRARAERGDASVDSGPASVDEATGTQSEPDVDLQETRIQPSIGNLALEVGDQRIAVSDGEAVGREIRNAMIETGGSEDEAVYIHRKHVRVDVKSGEFFVTRLGENSLTVNGQSVEKGDQVRIEDGDELRFSDVVTAHVSIR